MQNNKYLTINYLLYTTVFSNPERVELTLSTEGTQKYHIERKKQIGTSFRGPKYLLSENRFYDSV